MVSTNVLRALLDVYETMGADSRTITPPRGWSCARINYVVVIGRDGRASVEKLYEDDVVEAWNDDSVQPVPLRFKNDTGPWRHQSCFACTEIGDLIPSEDGCAKALDMYEHVFEQLASDEFTQSIAQRVRAVLCDRELWDNVESCSKLKGCACIKVYVRRPGERGRMVFLHKLDAFADAWDKTYEHDMGAFVAEHAVSGIDVTTGEVISVLPTQLHTKNFLVEKGNPAPIVSFNSSKSKAFSSYGFTGSNYGSISVETDRRICAASDWLVWSKRYVSFADGTRLFFWGKGVTGSVVESIRSLFSCDSREKVNVDNIAQVSGQINVMELRPNMARMSVQRVEQFDVDALAKRRVEWERHMALVDVKSFNLGGCLYFWEEFDGKERCDTVFESLRDSIVFGAAMSPSVLGCLARVVERDSVNCDDDEYCDTMGRKAALMKAYLIEACGLDIKETLMEDNDNMMYRLGRMIAVCDSVQYAAMGTSDMRRRFISAAAEFPRQTAIDVFEAYTLYSSILAKKKPGLAVVFDKLWCELVCDSEQMVELGSWASDEDKLQLYLGYYQQRRALFAKTASDDDSDDEE